MCKVRKAPSRGEGWGEWKRLFVRSRQFDLVLATSLLSESLAQATRQIALNAFSNLAVYVENSHHTFMLSAPQILAYLAHKLDSLVL